MKCECGYKLNDYDKFCPHCGKQKIKYCIYCGNKLDELGNCKFGEHNINYDKNEYSYDSSFNYWSKMKIIAIIATFIAIFGWIMFPWVNWLEIFLYIGVAIGVRLILEKEDLTHAICLIIFNPFTLGLWGLIIIFKQTTKYKNLVYLNKQELDINYEEQLDDQDTSYPNCNKQSLIYCSYCGRKLSADGNCIIDEHNESNKNNYQNNIYESYQSWKALKIIAIVMICIPWIGWTFGALGLGIAIGIRLMIEKQNIYHAICILLFNSLTFGIWGLVVVILQTSKYKKLMV